MPRAVVRATALVGLALLGVACGSEPGTSDGSDTEARYDYPAGPKAPTGQIDASVADAAMVLATRAGDRDLDDVALQTVVASGDPRLAWVIEDLLRFIQSGSDEEALIEGFGAITGVDPSTDPSFDESPWRSVTNHLIAWDLPAPPSYRELKEALYLAIEPAWKPFFDDADSAVDWRLVSWGGVLIDDRAQGDDTPCQRGCIPALDDPELTDASDGGWYPDDAIVFGITEGSESVALPKNIMQVHEMVNLTLGGRRLGVPYCTLCGSAQAYYTDERDGHAEIVLRTSGLLTRTNKVMFDLTTMSLFDTFTGAAVSGPLHNAALVLDQATVVVSTWGDWRRAHPGTRIVAEDGGIGVDYPTDPLQGRDDGGPIFPIGSADPRLPVQVEVLGVIAPDGTPVAFEVDAARRALAAGEQVAEGEVEVVADGGGLRARTPSGEELVAHESFWFAWSQFNPDTIVWTRLGS